MTKIICKILNRLGILKTFNLIVDSKVGSKYFRIPIINHVGFSNLHEDEVWMCSLLSVLLKIKEGTFIDIGVNLGQTLLKLKSVNYNIDYIGFEPNPSCVYYVENLIEANNWHNTTIVPVGINNKSGVLQLEFYGNNDVDSSASIIKEFRPEQKVYKRKYIPVFDWKDISSMLTACKLSVIKIDVEGAEYEVLSSIKPLLEKHQPFIIIELLPVYKSCNVVRLERQRNVERIMKDLNYDVYRIIKSSDDSYVGIEYLSEIDVHSDLKKCDYLFSPSTLRESLVN